MTVDEVLDRDAVGQAEAIAGREVSPTELVSAALERIEQRNPELNAVIHLFADEALAIAADPALPDGPFRGVPFLLKDGVAHSAGHPFHCGMQALKDVGHTEAADTEFVRRVRAAGFVIVGKTNLPGAGHHLHDGARCLRTDPQPVGRHPLTRAGRREASAAAVASGMVAVAHGNDMGGSIRLPASVCGLVGPQADPCANVTRSRPRRVLGSADPRVRARSVGARHGRAASTRWPARRSATPTRRPRRAARGVTRSAPTRDRSASGSEPTCPARRAESHPDCVAAVESTAELLADLGHRVERRRAARTR